MHGVVSVQRLTRQRRGCGQLGCVASGGIALDPQSIAACDRKRKRLASGSSRATWADGTEINSHNHDQGDAGDC